jgi:hypothetical protein
MFPSRSNLFALATALAVLVACAGSASAGWVAFRNDTSKTITVQEFTTVNGKKVTGKPTKLLPGESFREFQNNPGTKTYEVLDTNNNNQGLWAGSLSCKADTQLFSVFTLNGRTGVLQVQEPKKN